MTATPPKTPTPKPAKAKPRVKPLLAPEPEAVAEKPAAPPVRPVTLESAVFRNEIVKRRDEVAGAIDIIDASELQADADLDAAIKQLVFVRDAERYAQGKRRGDLTLILNGCKAALDASEEPAAA